MPPPAKRAKVSLIVRSSVTWPSGRTQSLSLNHHGFLSPCATTTISPVRQSWRRELRRLFRSGIDFTSDAPRRPTRFDLQVVDGLEVHPELRRAPEISRQPQRGVRGDCPP